jgi:hypothetical protein
MSRLFLAQLSLLLTVATGLALTILRAAAPSRLL